MTITSIQKVIKVGDSLAVTIPAKEARATGLEAGNQVEVSFKVVQTEAHKAENLDVEYEAFKKQYGQTLKNLTDR